MILVIGGTALLYGFGLGSNDLWTPDEPRYAAIAEELRSFRHGTRGLVLLHLNDVPYTQKPPLYFWLAAMFGLPFERVTELAARLPSAIAGVVSVGLTAWIGRLLLGRWTPALLGAGLLATSFRFAFTARRAQLDVVLCGFELLAIALFVLLEVRRGGIEEARRSPGILFSLHAALGAAALVKGPVGWLPLAVFGGYLIWEGRSNAFRSLSPIWSRGLSAGPLALWALSAVTLAPAGFAEAAIGDNLLGRFFTGTSHARPIYYFLYQLPLDFLPWSLLLPIGITIAWRWTRSDPPSRGSAIGTGRAARFLLCWALVPLVFFSLSAGKRGVYLLPIFPALALLAALAAGFERSGSKGGLAILSKRSLIRAVGVVALVELLLFTALLPRLDEEKSLRPIALAAAQHAVGDERLGVLGMTPLEGGLTYYGGPPVVSLRRTEDLIEFLASGGHLVLLRSRHLAELQSRQLLQEVQSFRSGARRLSLARTSAFLPFGDSE